MFVIVVTLGGLTVNVPTTEEGVTFAVVVIPAIVPIVVVVTKEDTLIFALDTTLRLPTVVIPCTPIKVTLPVVEKPNVPIAVVADNPVVGTTADVTGKTVPTDVVPDAEPNVTTAVPTIDKDPIDPTIRVAFVPDTKVTALPTTDIFPKLVDPDTPEMVTIILVPPGAENAS
jgi:hypothetical protein